MSLGDLARFAALSSLPRAYASIACDLITISAARMGRTRASCPLGERAGWCFELVEPWTPQEHVPACARHVEVMARLERSARSTRQVELRGRRSLAGRSSQFASPWPASLWCRGARW